MHFLFHGKSSFLSLREAKKKVEQIKNEQSDLEVITLDADSTELDIIIQNLSTTDMFAPGKILFIKRSLSNKKKKELSEAIIDWISVESDTTFAVFWEDSKVASNTRYFKAFNETKSAIEAPTLNKRTFMTWAKAELNGSDIKVETAAINLLAQHCNYEEERFFSELEKIKLSGNKNITVSDIEENSANTLETTIWYLLDVINGSKDGKPIKILDDLLNQRESAQFILAMIIRNTRLLIMTKTLLEQDTDSKSIAKQLKIPPFTVYALIGSAKKTTMEKLKSLYKMLYNLDFEIKTGNIEADLGLTLIATRL
jgi:DNA polymerase III subunit delta